MRRFSLPSLLVFLLVALPATAATRFHTGFATYWSYHHHLSAACGSATSPVAWSSLGATQTYRHCTLRVYVYVSQTGQAQTPSTPVTAAATQTPISAAPPPPPPTRTSPPSPTAVPPTSTPIPPSPTATPLPVLGPVYTPPTQAPVPNATCNDDGTGCDQFVLNLLNGERAHMGTPPLTLDAAISNGSGSCVGAIGHSQAMAQSGSIWHQNSAYPSASFPADICGWSGTAGQNVGMGYGLAQSAVQQIHAEMMAESGYTPGCTSSHKCNILYAGYHRVGIGVVVANGATWLTESFSS